MLTESDPTVMLLLSPEMTQTNLSLAGNPSLFLVPDPWVMSLASLGGGPLAVLKWKETNGGAFFSVLQLCLSSQGGALIKLTFPKVRQHDEPWYAM